MMLIILFRSFLLSPLWLTDDLVIIALRRLCPILPH